MPSKSLVLVISPAGPAVDDLRHLLGAGGHETLHAPGVEEAGDLLAGADAVLLGVHGPCVEDVGRLARAAVAPPIVALVAGASTSSILREARRLGATDALLAADGVEALLLAVERAIDAGRMRREVAMLRARVGDRVAASLIGRSPAIAGVRELIGRAAASRITVLVSGEAGTGKDVVARLIHELSDRADRPFVTVRCDAGADMASLEAELFGTVVVRGGLLDRARGGTLVLDEAEGLATAARDRLVHRIAERTSGTADSSATLPIDVRLLVTTRAGAPAAPAGLDARGMGQVAMLPIALPPLRERRSDIPLLVQHFRARVAREIGEAALPPLGPDAMLTLIGQPWPGNVRELEHFVERGVHRPGIGASTTVATMFDDGATLEELERRYILHVLEREHGHQSRAADRLGIDRRTLYRKLKQYRDEGVGTTT